MDFDLDDLISFDDANNVKASTKFQPKLKPKPKPKPKTQPDLKTAPKPEPNPPTQFVEASTIADKPGDDANPISTNVNDDLQSSFDKLQQEHAESFHTLDSPDKLFPESTTTAGPTESDLTNNVDASTNFDSLGEIDPLSPSQTSAGPRFGKYKPKPRAQTRKPEHDASKTDYMENEHVPMFTPDEATDDAVPTETISDYTLNVEPRYLEEISQMVFGNEGGRSSEKKNKTFELIDEAEDEGYGDDLTHRNENNNDNDNDHDFEPESESLKEKKGSKSKKSIDKTKKPARKRKKAAADDVGPSESEKVVKKKFIHRTKRTKRQVNQELLKMPEDELELHMHNVPIRDIIRLREHKERLEKKEASTSGTTAVNQSSSNPFDEDEAYAHGEGSGDEHDNSVVAQNATHYNYGTHMNKSQRMKWTKQDTELFYEAIQQFGTDLSMIKECCFPDRTRQQIKSKFKKEERSQPLRINDALTTRAGGISHFKAVIDRLKKDQEEEYDEDDPMNLVGEDEEGLPTHDINESVDATKPVPLEKEKDKEGDVPAVESPTKSHDSEDEMYLWSQYKSEI